MCPQLFFCSYLVATSLNLRHCAPLSSELRLRLIFWLFTYTRKMIFLLLPSHHISHFWQCALLSGSFFWTLLNSDLECFVHCSQIFSALTQSPHFSLLTMHSPLSSELFWTQTQNGSPQFWLLTILLTLTLTLSLFNQSKNHLPPDLAADEALHPNYTKCTLLFLLKYSELRLRLSLFTAHKYFLFIPSHHISHF